MRERGELKLEGRGIEMRQGLELARLSVGLSGLIEQKYKVRFGEYLESVNRKAKEFGAKKVFTDMDLGMRIAFGFSRATLEARGGELYQATLGCLKDVRKMERETGESVKLDMRFVDLEGADMRFVDLTGADLTKADLTGADLRNANLRAVKLMGADLWMADLRGIDLAEADLWGANLVGVNLRCADLTDADLGRALLAGADITGAEFVGADLTGVDLRGVVGLT